MIKTLVGYVTIFVAPFILSIFSLISAYVLRFKLKGSGLGFDYIVFSILTLLTLKIGGAI